MPDEVADDDPASFILEGLKDLPAHTRQPQMTLAEISALLASFERAKKRLVVPKRPGRAHTSTGRTRSGCASSSLHRQHSLRSADRPGSDAIRLPSTRRP